MTDYITDWMTDWMSNLQYQDTDWLSNWLTVQLGTWLADRMTDRAADWLTEWLMEQLTEWLTKLSNFPSDWLTASNWLTDLGTDWGPQSRSRFNKTFTSVIYKCNPLWVSYHPLIKWTSLLHSNELQFSPQIMVASITQKGRISD